MILIGPVLYITAYRINTHTGNSHVSIHSLSGCQTLNRKREGLISLVPRSFYNFRSTGFMYYITNIQKGRSGGFSRLNSVRL